MTRQRVLHLGILLSICAIVFGFKAGGYEFWGRHGEVRRAEVSREMVISGNWVVPHLNGEAFITKPPLYYWAGAGMFTITGRFDELSARLPSIISGALGVVVTYVWASMLFSSRVGLLAGIILATNFMYAGMARTAGVDMMLTLFTTAALCCFTGGYLRREKFYIRRKKWNRSMIMYVLSTVCIGLGTLCKYPIGFVVPLLAIGGFILVTRNFRLMLETKPWWLLLVFLLVVLPWFVLVYQQVPNFFEVLHQETLGRYTDPGETPHYEPFYYYIPALGAFAPWVLFLPGVSMALIIRKKHQFSASHRFVVIAFVTTFFLFSSVGSKREYYLLPLYPFLAILVAKYWDEYFIFRKTTQTSWVWKGMRAPNALFAGAFSLIGISLPLAAKLYLPQYMVVSVIFGLLFLECGIMLFLVFLRKEALRTFATLTFAIILAYLFALLTIVPETNVYRSRKDFLHEAAKIIGNQPVVDYNYESYEVQFYLQRIVPVLTEIEELEAFVAREQTGFAVMPGRHLDRLQREHPELAENFEVMLERTWISATNPKRQKRLVLAKHENT